MPEHLKSLGVILVLAAVAFTIAKAPACAMACGSKDFERRRNLWFALTLTAFLAHSYWIYLTLAALLLFFALRNEQNSLAMYFLVLFAVPPIDNIVPGMGLINHLISIDYLRLLALTILLPAFFSLRKRPDTVGFGRTLPDKLLAGYLILGFLLWSQHSTFTNALRNGVLYAFTDVFLPYYVASRSLRSMKDFRDVLMAYAVAAMVLSLILFFEFAKHWLLYQSLEQALGMLWGWNNYLWRGSHLRAAGPVGHPIVAGVVIAVALAFFVYLRKVVPNGSLWGLGMMLLIAGLIAPLSRGPWVGAAAMMFVIVATGRAPAVVFARIGLIGLIALPLLLATPAGKSIIDYLPWVGTIEASTVEGRLELAEVSLKLFLDNPLLGSTTYLETPEMEAMRGGDGLIDVVNTYVIIGLGSGLAGLSLFVGFFLAVGLGIYKGMRNLADRHGEQYVLGQTLLSALLGMLIIIGTVSPVLVIPAIYSSVAGLGVAYVHMLARRRASSPEISAEPGAAMGYGRGS